MHSFASAGDIRLAYRRIGRPTLHRPILLITGYGCTMDLWPTSLLGRLAATREVVIADNRGMGLSGAGDPNTFTIPQFARDIIALIRQLGCAPFDLLGWSMGGMIAMEAALLAPELFGDLFLHATYCSNEPLLEDQAAWQRLTDTSGTLDERTARMFASLFPKAWLDCHPNPAVNFPTPTEPVRDDSIALQTKAIQDWEGECDRVGSIHSRAVVIAGSEDTVIPLRYAKRLAASLANSSLVVVGGAGHGLMYQDPVRLAEIVAEA